MAYKNRSDLYAAQARHRERNFQMLWDLLVRSECSDCGESDPVVLEFDHLPGEAKRFEIAGAVARSTRSWKLIETEIAKCEIVCANCHKRRTSRRGGHRRHVLSVSVA